jgi:hypothetical protein
MNRPTRIPFAYALAAALAALVAGALTAAPSAAWTSDPAVNTPICTAADNQSSPVTVPDGMGGVFIGWNDSRTSTTGDLYVQHLDAKGNALWGTNGKVLCDAPDTQGNLKLLADGAGGVFGAWTDLRSGLGTRDIWAQHLDAAGDPVWLANGISICNAINNQLNVKIAHGAPQFGELLLVWEDWRGVDTDIYVQGVNASGAIRYAINGVVICNAVGDQKRPTVVEDGAGGVIVGWQDFRSATTLDAYAQRFLLGANMWTANGVGLCVLAGNQQELAGTSDGSGGAIFAWDDDRAGVGNHDVYGNRVDMFGTRLWGTNGVVIDNNALTQGSIDIAPDGSHGAYVVWAEGDIRAQHMLAAGGRAFNGGAAICTAASSQLSPQIATDGNGGAFITWYDQRSGEADIYAARLLVSGQTWTANGVPIGTATLNQFFPTLAADGRGAAIVAWGDGRLGNSSAAFDIYAQRIDRFGSLGEPEPVITSLVDVPGDEGGSLMLGWNASPLVTPGTVASYSYRLWRATPVADGAMSTGGAHSVRATTLDPDQAARAGGPLFAPEFQASSTAWEWVATMAADLSPSYSVVVPTAYDSVPGPNPPQTQYMVELLFGSAGPNRFSLPDSARSVDNLPPAAPSPFTGEYAAGEAHLHWDPNTEPDFKVYVLHRGDAPGFTPTPLTYVATLTDTGYVDVTGVAYVYQLIAVDVHGNASSASEVVPSGTTDVPGAGASLAFLGQIAPNPSRGDVTMRFGLPGSGRASVDVFDASGRRVRSLARGELAAGEHLARWDGRDATGGLCPAGIYFVRMQTAGFRAERRLVRMR